MQTNQCYNLTTIITKGETVKENEITQLEEKTNSKNCTSPILNQFKELFFTHSSSKLSRKKNQRK